MVRLTHPKLPGRPISVSEERVSHFERAGWRRETRRSSKPAGTSAGNKPADGAGGDTEGAAS